MQQLFPLPAIDPSQPSKAEVIDFAVPDTITADVGNQLKQHGLAGASRKRDREDGKASGGQAASSKTGATRATGSELAGCSLSTEDFRALARFMVFGGHPLPCATQLKRRLRQRGNPANVLAQQRLGVNSGAGGTRGTSEGRAGSQGTVHTATAAAVAAAAATVSGGSHDHVYSLLLRHALSLVCRVVALDPAGYFLRGSGAENQADRSPTQAVGKERGGASASTTAATSSSPPVASSATATTPPRSTLDLYCLLQGLELELEDARTTQHFGDRRASPHPPLNAHAGQSPALAEVEQRIDRSIDAMEGTLIDLFLSYESPSAVPLRASAAAPTAGNVAAPCAPREYVTQILKELPGAFDAEGWPCHVFECAQTTLPHSSFTAALEAPEEGVFAGPLAERLLQSSSARREVGEAITAVVLSALLDVRRKDCCNTLGAAATPALSRVAAALFPPTIPRRKQPPRASGGSAEHNDGELSAQDGVVALHVPDSSTVLNLEALHFADLLAKAWVGAYRLQGLRRVNVEMQALCYRLRRENDDRGGSHTAGSASASSAAKHPGGRVPASLRHKTSREIELLFATWKAALGRRCTEFLSRLAAPEVRVEEEVASLAVARDSVFDILEAGAAPSLTPVQQRCLRVLDTLRAVDRQGWFAVPAFDLVNVDFRSIRVWVKSASFAQKTNRTAFDALRRVLESMVDKCVRKYGPTHEYSMTITAARQKLVDAARAEGLL